ncbi:MAG: ribokinase [Caldiserica bacterium]|nr:ribokinase [Caldisericota bacterium]
MVISFGSINMDLVVRCERAPEQGETIVSTGWLTNPGGKGANQAVQASRIGAETFLVGRVGSDAFGRDAMNGLSAYRVDVGGVMVDPILPTGVAYILVERSGENRIVVVPGANGAVGAAELKILEGLLQPGAVLLLQCEIPFAVVLEAARIAHEKGATVILDPSPWESVTLMPGVFADVDYLMPNEGEARALAGTSNLDAAAAVFLGMGARTVVLKRGDKGVVAAGAFECPEVPAFSVVAVDTTAAGDSFQGAFAASLDLGFDADTALCRAMAAAALTVTRMGAQQSMPDEVEVTAFLEARLHKGDHLPKQQI